MNPECSKVSFHDRSLSFISKLFLLRTSPEPLVEIQKKFTQMIPIALRFDPECKFSNKTAFPIAKNDVLDQKNARLPFGQSGSSEPSLDPPLKNLLNL